PPSQAPGRGHGEGISPRLGDSATVLGVTLLSLSPAVGVTPPVRIESSSSSVAEGQTLDLNCIVARQGQATVTWYKRGGSLPAKHQVGDTEEHLGVSGTRLRIPQVTAADSGEYVCRVMSGSVTHETSLIVTIQTGTGSSYGTGMGALRALHSTQAVLVLMGTPGAPHPTWAVPLGSTGGLHLT
uniref:Ig-like domain-containing protein n=1 Tax=Catharus ustulatus TaxID=91951 RepID=A0A8C3Y695_CATUS